MSLLGVLGVGLLDPATAILLADDVGVTRGDGCFEGLRIRTDPAGRSTVHKLDMHLARMSRSSAALDIAFDEDGWRSLIAESCASWNTPGEAALKLVLTRGPASGTSTGFLTVSPLPSDYPRQRREGLRVITLSRGVTSDAFAGAPWLLGGVKTLSYAVNMAAQREAERRGADEAVLVSTDGKVLEAPTGSVVWSIGRTLHTTPPGATGILSGTTQRLLFERAVENGWATAESLVSVDDLHRADVVWVISSVRGPVDVVALDGKQRPRVPEVDAEIRSLCGF